MIEVNFRPHVHPTCVGVWRKPQDRFGRVKPQK